jgi:hypothetical protein
MAAFGASASAPLSSRYHIPSGKRVSRALESISCSNKELDQSIEEISRSTIAVARRREGTRPSVIDRACTGIEPPRTSIGARRWVEASPRCTVRFCCSVVGTPPTVVGPSPTIVDPQFAVVDSEATIVRSCCSAMVNRCSIVRVRPTSIGTVRSTLTIRRGAEPSRATRRRPRWRSSGNGRLIEPSTLDHRLSAASFLRSPCPLLAPPQVPPRPSSASRRRTHSRSARSPASPRHSQ